MGKREELIHELKPIISNRSKLEKYIIEHSILPGPRGNLELAFALAEIYESQDVVLEWTRINEAEADVNDPKSFLAFCGAVCLGKIYTKTKSRALVKTLKSLANDGRWRMREAVAFAFQIIGEDDFDELKSIMSGWIQKSNNLEKRAILVSLAHPPFLNAERAGFCLEIADDILSALDRERDFDVLEKGLKFTISVFASADPKAGFAFMKRWIGKDKVIDKIMLANLKKSRLAKPHPHEVSKLIDAISTS